ncbi:MAG: ankyrin repeat domain-containing protein [Gammaproteobacteria bacterium]|nr:ankyrin repeat domain-containing protein [Gammaproteobacteria bacterium]
MINGSQMAFAKSLRTKDETNCLRDLEQVENLNFVMKNKTTGILFECIHLVAEYGLLAVLKMMVERGFSIKAQDGHGQTGLFIAQAAGKSEMIDIFMSAAPQLCTVGNNKGVTPIHLAAKLNDVGSLNKYLSTGIECNTIRDADGQTPLHWAAKHGSRDAVDVLMLHGAKANVIDNADCLPRHLASVCGHHDLAKYLQTKEISLFELCALAVQDLAAVKEVALIESLIPQQQAIVVQHQALQEQLASNKVQLEKQQTVLTEKLKTLSLNT